MIILVVGSNPVLPGLIEESLATAGHQVLGPAATNLEAIRIADDASPDLVLIDIALPSGDSGIELGRVLEAEWRLACLFVRSGPAGVTAADGVGLGSLEKACPLATLLRSIEIVGLMLKGLEPPEELPDGFEIFRRRAGGRQEIAALEA